MWLKPRSITSCPNAGQKEFLYFDSIHFRSSLHSKILIVRKTHNKRKCLTSKSLPTESRWIRHSMYTKISKFALFANVRNSVRYPLNATFTQTLTYSYVPLRPKMIFFSADPHGCLPIIVISGNNDNFVHPIKQRNA